MPSAEPLINKTKKAKKFLADKAYDSAELRKMLKNEAQSQSFRDKRNRKQPFSFSKKSYKDRHLIENAFCRLKDIRRIATRYDRLAINFAATIYLVGAVVWWIL